MSLSPVASQKLDDRLNQLLDRLVSDDLLSGQGIGNEISFYIFDYPAEAELRVREKIASLVVQLPKRKAGLRVAHVNLFDVVLGYLKGRNLLDRVLEKGRAQGDDQLVKSISPLTEAEKIRPTLLEVAQPESHDLILISGVGSVYPLLRGHDLLNNLHAHTNKPVVLFYPGRYDGQSLTLFNKIPAKNYYRAFQLVP